MIRSPESVQVESAPQSIKVQGWEGAKRSPKEGRGFLYVGAIPFGSKEDTIRKLFLPFGPVYRVTTVADWENPTFEPHALVELQNPKEAIAKMDGKKIGNTYLRVHEGARHGN